MIKIKTIYKQKSFVLYKIYQNHTKSKAKKQIYSYFSNILLKKS